MEPRDYIRKINALGIRKLSQSRVKNVSDARNLLKEVRNMQKGIRQIKKEINLEIKTIRQQYKEKSSTAGAASSLALGLLAQRGVARSIRASAKRGVAQDRDRTIAPFEEPKMRIDDMLIKMDKFKLQLEQYIQKEEARK